MKDVVVIGGGIVGTSILRELSYYKLDLALIEKQPDVCEGSSKGNSGIIHTGFDSPQGSLEAACLRRSRARWPELIEQLKIPYLPCGAIMIATSEQELNKIKEHYIPNAAAHDVQVQWLEKEEIIAANPALSEQVVLGGILIEGEGIVDPFWATRAFAELAALNGAEIILNNGVQSIKKDADADCFELLLEHGQRIRSRYVINAAGLWSDEIAKMVGDTSFQISARKGQFVLTEDPLDITQIILPVPTPTSKGILITPVVFGGFMLGPTAEDQEDKWDRSTTASGMKQVLTGAEKFVPGLRSSTTIRQFAGVRAVCSTGDYVIRASDQDRHFIHAAGIRSTGISAAPGIADRIVELLAASDLALHKDEQAQHALPELFEQDLETTGEIVCLCRNITRSEIERAMHSPVPCQTIDGIKRRTGAMLGECQGNYCLMNIVDVVKEAPHFNSKALMKGLQHSEFAISERSESS